MDQVKTRGELKQELLTTIPEGEEGKFLLEAEQKLEEMKNRLLELQTQRASTRRGITIRERKLRDWKGKIPRVGDVPDSSEVLKHVKALLPVTCVKIGDIDDNCEILSIGDKYVGALSGLSGFDKMWVILHNKNSTDADETNGEFMPSAVVVDIVECDEKNGKIKIDGLDQRVGGGVVLDIKPYLPYCEAWPS